jgi:hypothetical protein
LPDENEADVMVITDDLGVYSSVGFPSESILTLLPKYSVNFSGERVWIGMIVVGLSA